MTDLSLYRKISTPREFIAALHEHKPDPEHWPALLAVANDEEFVSKLKEKLTHPTDIGQALLADDLITARQRLRAKIHPDTEKAISELDPLQLPAALYPRLSRKDGNAFISFYANPAMALQDKRTLMKPMKFIQRFGEHLDTEQRQELFQRFRGKYERTVQWARTREEIHAVYEGGGQSCMTSVDCPNDIHPVECYASPDIGLAHLTVDGRTHARIVCNMVEKTFSRGYGHEAQLLRELLEAQGFRHATYALQGCRLLHLTDDRKRWIQPYIDFCDGAWTRKDGAGNIAGLNWGQMGTTDPFTDTNGVMYRRINTQGHMADYDTGLCKATDCEYSTCNCCGDEYPEDDMVYSSYMEHVYCECCRDNGSVVFAYVRCGRDWIPEDDAICCESDNEWYHEDHLDCHGVVRVPSRGEYYREGDCIYDDYREEYVHENDSRRCDHDGDDYHEDDFLEIRDGVCIHERYKDYLVRLDCRFYPDDLNCAHEDDAVETPTGTYVLDEDSVQLWDGQHVHGDDPDLVQVLMPEGHYEPGLRTATGIVQLYTGVYVLVLHPDLRFVADGRWALAGDLLLYTDDDGLHQLATETRHAA